eukprot:CAMPEP_0170547622 /NCGR_PEP_ID=MMETSP0211-20121228/6018_1 /TAXON_ID=311385 /ORGANISM="Pseudokeronopsis sp., Strain OXSARD2" /LENGTH=100 /DNA_ID=CAMNT_0010852767 /DNA_START=488 /DNA_END=790 /DNA_ORIENTATION=+
MAIEKKLNDFLIQDNPELVERIPWLKETKSIPISVLEELKVRALHVMSREQMMEYDSSQENIDKMKARKHQLAKTFKELPYLHLSFYSRYHAMEVCFGNV